MKKEALKQFKYIDGELFKKGKIVGSVNNQEYKQVKIDGKQYKIHQLVYLIHHGFMPEFIDHSDGNKLNNKIENLRACTKQENQFNRKIQKNNTSGVKGVTWKEENKKWQVTFKVDKKLKFFGYYFDLQVAKFVCETMRHKYHGRFANHG